MVVAGDALPGDRVGLALQGEDERQQGGGAVPQDGRETPRINHYHSSINSWEIKKIESK